MLVYFIRKQSCLKNGILNCNGMDILLLDVLRKSSKILLLNYSKVRYKGFFIIDFVCIWFYGKYIQFIIKLIKRMFGFESDYQ